MLQSYLSHATIDTGPIAIARIQRMSKRKNQQALRTKALRTVPVPQRLGELISLVNLLPSDMISEDKIVHAWSTGGQPYKWEGWIAEYRKAIELLPKTIQKFIGPVQVDTL